MKDISLSFGKEIGKIRCCEDVFSEILIPRRGEFTNRGAFVFTDSNVSKLYGARLKESLPDLPVYVMPAGEANKNEQTLFALLQCMAEAGLRRNSVLLALGGGVVCDVGGLAASLYMRGIDCILLPTTLLAQADAAVGGKTAIDFHHIKNLLGSFRLPREVWLDPSFLRTLPARELRCGLGEIVKHGALNAPLFETLWAGKARLADVDFLAELVPESATFKSTLVQKDPFEENLRKCLNLGHTTAHALELDGELTHGECVLLGLIYESQIAARHVPCDEKFLGRLRELAFSALGGNAVKLTEDALSKAVYDKKNISSGKVVLTVPTALEKYALLELPLEQYVEELKEAEKQW